MDDRSPQLVTLERCSDEPVTGTNDLQNGVHQMPHECGLCNIDRPVLR